MPKDKKQEAAKIINFIKTLEVIVIDPQDNFDYESLLFNQYVKNALIEKTVQKDEIVSIQMFGEISQLQIHAIGEGEQVSQETELKIFKDGLEKNAEISDLTKLFS